jgi:hypothetical protein
MPQWNSTYDMLVFAIEYKIAIKAITSDIDLKLVKYQLSLEEWVVTEELCRALEV